MNKQFAWFQIDFNLSELLPAFTCARAIGNYWSICLGVNILSPVSSCFISSVALDLILA